MEFTSYRDAARCYTGSQFCMSMNGIQFPVGGVLHSHVCCRQKASQFPKQTARIPAMEYLLLVSFVSFLLHSSKCDKDSMYRLKRDLMLGYDSLVLPKTGSNATHLVLTLHPQNINLDEQKSTLTLAGVLVMGWMDMRMKWNPADYAGERYAFFDEGQLWKPELTVYNNAATRDAHQFGKQRIVATNTGTVYWSPVVKFQTTCSHNFKNWPFDSTLCSVRIGSWDHTGDDVFMALWNPKDPNLNLTDLIPNADWDIKLKRFGIRDQIFDCCPKYQEFYSEWRLERRYVYPFAAIYVPAIALAWIILTSFWMNPRSVERSALIFTAFVINTWFLNYTYKTVPLNGDNVPLIVEYYSRSLQLVCTALLWTIWSRFIAETKRTSKIPLPSIILTFLESWPSQMLFIAPRAQDSGVTLKMTEDDPSLTALSSLVNNDWAWLAHLLDRIVFALYLVLYFIFMIAYL